jgi:tetratricopeptide (TPR) repeat protein
MALRSLFLPLLLLLIPFQSQGDLFRERYRAAEAQRRAGNLVAAEAEYKAILAEAYYKLGKIYSAQGNYQEAMTTLERASSLPDSPTEVLVDLAIAYFHAGQYQKAFAPLTKALALNPQSAAARHMLGKTHFMLGEFEKATPELEAALKLAPKDYDVAYTLGLAHLKRRQFPAAKEIYDRMVEQLGDRPQLRVLIGRAYRETGFLPEAIEEFKKAIALNPRFERVHYYLGLTYLLKDGADKLSDAAKEFEIELAAHPEEFFANYYLGILSIMERKWERAVTLLEKASRLQPDNPDPYFHLGQAYQSLEQHGQAIEVLKKAIALNPQLRHNDYQVTTAHYRLGQSLLKVGRKEEGEKELQVAAELKSQAFKTDEKKLESYLSGADQQGKIPELVSAQGIVAEPLSPGSKVNEDLKSGAAFYSKVIASAHNNIGLLRAERQDFRGAAEHFGEVAKLDPQFEGLNFNLGLASFKAELYREAIPPLERELAAHPNSLPAKQLLGLSYFMVDNYKGASGLLTEVIASKTNDAGLYYTLALALIKQGKQETADRVIRQMVAMTGQSPQVHILMGQAYYSQGETNKSLEELRAALVLDSKTLMAHYYSGLIYLKLGKFEEAAREFEAELALNPDDAQAKYHLAFVRLARQEFEPGIKLMREVIALKPDFADARYELGKALLQQQDTRGAIENLEAAVKLGPDKSHIHYQLGRAYLAAGRKAEGESQIEISRQLKEKERGPTNP